jgi:hypothetical protein
MEGREFITPKRKQIRKTDGKTISSDHFEKTETGYKT